MIIKWKYAVVEAARNLSCVGAEPIAVTDNLNFGSPEKPIGYWQLANACKGVSDACREMKTPVTGGNVSLYNETLNSEGVPQPIYPTPVIGMVGIVPDLSKVCGQSWLNQDDAIYLLGSTPKSQDSAVTLGASEYLAAIHNNVAGKPPEINFELEKLVQSVCRQGIRQGLINSAHDCGEGGLAIALAESCIGNEIGANINLEISEHQRLDEVLFGEGGNRILVSVSSDNLEEWEAYLIESLPHHWNRLGSTTEPKSNLKITTKDNLSLINVKIGDIKKIWYGAIQNRL